jgi:hypothetical protein
MAKLHELLAVDSNLKGQAGKCRSDLTNTFEKKRHLFQEKLVRFSPLGEGKEPQTESQSSIQTTVRDEVLWLSNLLAKQVDCSFAIDIANTEAKGDIILDDGKKLATGIPTTALLQLEHRVKEVLEFAKQIPTLDPAKSFTPDEARPKGTYIAREVKKVRTQKIEEHVVVVQPTKEHPAQVVKQSRDVETGTIQELEWSSLVTPADKAKVLERAEQLLRAITQARSRANGQEIDPATHRIGKTLLDHVFQPLLA